MKLKVQPSFVMLASLMIVEEMKEESISTEVIEGHVLHLGVRYYLLAVSAHVQYALLKHCRDRL